MRRNDEEQARNLAAVTPFVGSGLEQPESDAWNRLAKSEKFQRLLRAKRRFIIPASIIFVLYYFALPLLVGYARPMMEQRVFGAVNVAYLFALSQFLMAWIVAALYVRAAAKFDRMAQEVLRERN